MRISSVLISLAVMAASVGCVGPAKDLLPDPPASHDRTAAERYYKAYAPITVGRTVVISGGASTATAGAIDRMTLANGQEILDPRQLALAVGSESPTGNAIADVERIVPTHNAAIVTELSVLGLGLAGMLTPLAFTSAPDNVREPILIGGLAGGGALLLSSMFVVPVLFGSPAPAMAKATQRAFVTYDASLREKLCLPDTDGQPTCDENQTLGGSKNSTSL